MRSIVLTSSVRKRTAVGWLSWPCACRLGELAEVSAAGQFLFAAKTTSVRPQTGERYGRLHQTGLMIDGAMATIGDVARYAGVSRSTVSHALSGKRPISAETRLRVAEAITELNYTANAGARALATSRSSIMALIVPFTPEEFAPATMQYVLVISQTARKLGYDILLVTEEEGAAGIRRVTESNLVDGLIVLDVKRHDNRIASIANAQQPAVLVGVPENNGGSDLVDLDFAEAGALLIDHLSSLGHREVLFFTLPEQIFSQDLGYAWLFREAALARATEREMRLIQVVCDSDPDRRAEQISAALDAHPAATAILVHNDGALVELPQILAGRNLQVPADVSVVSLFPEQFGRMFSLPYTAIETSAAVVAERAVRILAERIETSSGPEIRELVPPIIVDRGSTRAI